MSRRRRGRPSTPHEKYPLRITTTVLVTRRIAKWIELRPGTRGPTIPEAASQLLADTLERLVEEGTLTLSADDLGRWPPLGEIPGGRREPVRRGAASPDAPPADISDPG